MTRGPAATGAQAERRATSTATASAPAKAILLGEHGVNRRVTALGTALELRLYCRVALREDGVGALRTGTAEHREAAASVQAHRTRIKNLRAGGDQAGMRAAARGDFFAATRFVLGALSERLGLQGLSAEWHGALPVGRGLGSGAAASCALIVAAAHAAGTSLGPAEVAGVAWEGDLVAHGGTASALDASASAFGGVIAYDLDRGARPLAAGAALALVVADTGVDADTGTVNAGVRRRLAARPELGRLFDAMAGLTSSAQDAVREADHPALGRLMSENQRLLAALGVSCPEIDRLVAAALGAGAYGAKLSGSGGGGIVVALAAPCDVQAVAAAMAGAGGRILVAGTSAGAPGARIEPSQSFTPRAPERP